MKIDQMFNRETYNRLIAEATRYENTAVRLRQMIDAVKRSNMSVRDRAEIETLLAARNYRNKRRKR